MRVFAERNHKARIRLSLPTNSTSSPTMRPLIVLTVLVVLVGGQTTMSPATPTEGATVTPGDTTTAGVTVSTTVKAAKTTKAPPSDAEKTTTKEGGFQNWVTKRKCCQTRARLAAGW